MKTVTLVVALSCLVLRVVAQAQEWGQCGGVGWYVHIAAGVLHKR